MRGRITVIWLAALGLLLASLSALSLLAGREGYRNLLLVTPNTFGTPGQSPQRLEEFSEEEFLLTYEIRQPATAQAVGGEHPVTLVGTNHSYAGIMGYPFLDGGFFTKAAMDAKSRYAVLNEAAAFALFGSGRISGSTLKLGGETWIIAGVLRDGDAENARIYAPAGVTGGQAASLMVLTDETVTEAYVKNALKGIGIHENSYDFISLSKSAKAFGERFSVAWKTALSAAILFFMLKTGGSLREGLRLYRDRLRELYFRELLARHRADFLKTAGGALLLAAGTGAMLSLSLQILETCLTWQELMPVTGELTAGDFGNRLLWLRDYQTPGCVLFGACVCLILLCFLLALLRPARETKGRTGKREVPALYGKSELA